MSVLDDALLAIGQLTQRVATLEGLLDEIKEYLDTTVLTPKPVCPEAEDPCDDPCPIRCCQKCIDTLLFPFIVPEELAGVVDFCRPEEYIGLCFLLAGSNGKQACIRVTDSIEEKAVYEILEGLEGDRLEAPVRIHGPFKCPQEIPEFPEIPAVKIESVDACIHVGGTYPCFSLMLDADAIAAKVCEICSPPPDAARVKGIVWQDINNDGIPNENLVVLGLEGVTVNICDPNAVDPLLPVYTGVTGPGGVYDIQIAPGEWTVKVDETTVPLLGSTPTTLTSYQFVIADGECEAGKDFGFIVPPTAVGLEYVCVSGDGNPSTVTWQHANEANVLGYIILCDAAPVTGLILAGPGTYSQDVTCAGVVTLKIVYDDLQEEIIIPPYGSCP